MIRKVFLETYGCQMNVADSELVSSILNADNFQISQDIDRADVIIFNTCSVRQHAEDRVLGRISNEIARKQSNKDLKIGVIGCMAQRIGDELHEINKDIDFIAGVDSYKKLPIIIESLFKDNDFIAETQTNNQEIYDGIYPSHSGRFNAFVTIMRGCNNFCSYCIVPYTRGRERSRPWKQILKEIELLGNENFKDITLLGQNVNSYIYEDIKFADLLRKVNKIESINRIRFVTSHPKDLSDEVISVMAESAKVCEHIHLPMQSGDDKILREMNRGYSSDHYLKLIKKLRNAIPNIAITTDIIAGFPGETSDQFQRTYDLMQEIEFDYAFTFKYSPRTGTKAADLPDQIPEELRLERLKSLINLQQNITKKKYRDQIGTTKEIYVEKISKKSDSELAGKSRDFKITVFPGDQSLIGEFVKVKITDATGWTLKGQVVK